jgi:hypothetical protein
LRHIRSYRRQLSGSADSFEFRLTPVLSDRYAVAGIAKGHYFHQDLWAARRIFAAGPAKHVDIGSRIDGFVAHLLSFREVYVIDIRAMQSQVPGLTFCQLDVMSGVENNIRADSVSCLHALEHFGLGRYGDPIDVDGWKKGIDTIVAIADSGARIYLSVPISSVQRIEFNAHRVFLPTTLPEYLRSRAVDLVEQSYVDDEGNFHENTCPPVSGLEFGCGCYVFKKR